MSYELIKQYNSQHTHIKFDGPFQGITVTWDTHFFTLNGYQKQKKSKNLNSKQFIHIEPAETSETDTLKLTVVLKIPKISEPNIQKMIMMIKQYKHLSIGRHEYG